MEQGKELAMIEGQSKICEELQIINDRLTGDNQELTQHNTMLTMQVGFILEILLRHNTKPARALIFSRVFEADFTGP